MRMIVVTGGAGFIGSALIWQLNQQGRENILAVDALSGDERWKNLARLRFADYLDRDDFIAKLESGRLDGAIEGVLHLGACSSTTENDLGFLMRNNYEYTKRLAVWCLEYKKRFVYASSAATYGDGELGFSDDPAILPRLKPMNGYAFSKWQFDLWALRGGTLNQMAGLKYFNVFGPNEYHKADMRSVVHKAFEQIRQTGKVQLFKSHRPEYKDGQQLRDFIYVKDAVAATLAIYDRPEVNGIYNVGTGKARSFLDLANATFAAMDRQPNIEFIDMPESIREKYQYFTQADAARLKTVWPAPFTDLESAVSDYVCNYLHNDDPYLQHSF
jgi:ADP-L-glycero-D-manno-heptose 6-epimerase